MPNQEVHEMAVLTGKRNCWRADLRDDMLEDVRLSFLLSPSKPLRKLSNIRTCLVYNEVGLRFETNMCVCVNE
jgi:hypothetical protein